MKKWLVFNVAETGHHGEWLRSVAAWAPQLEARGESLVIAAAAALVPGILECMGGESENRRVVPVACTPPKPIRRTSAAVLQYQGDFRCFLRVLHDVEATHGVLLHFNLYQLAFAGVGRKLQVPVRGVLLNPPRPPTNSRGGVAQVLARFFRERRILALRLALRCPAVSRVFTPNDRIASVWLNQRLAPRSVCEMIPDPIPEEIVVGASAIRGLTREPERASSARTVRFLFFGTMSARKGVVEFLAGVEEWRRHVGNPKEVTRIVVDIVGLFAVPAYRASVERIAGALTATRVTGTEVTVSISDARASQPRVAECFRATDFVVLPYLGFEGSSGVLGLAAAFERPVLASSTGLVGELVNEYQLGLTMAVSSPREVARAVELAVAGNVRYNRELAARYVRERTSAAFCKALFAS